MNFCDTKVAWPLSNSSHKPEDQPQILRLRLAKNRPNEAQDDKSKSSGAEQLFLRQHKLLRRRAQLFHILLASGLGVSAYNGLRSR